MDPSLLGLIEPLLIVGVVFGLGFAQLVSLRRDKRQRQRASQADSAANERP